VTGVGRNVRGVEESTDRVGRNREPTSRIIATGIVQVDLTDNRRKTKSS